MDLCNFQKIGLKDLDTFRTAEFCVIPIPKSNQTDKNQGERGAEAP